MKGVFETPFHPSGSPKLPTQLLFRLKIPAYGQCHLYVICTYFRLSLLSYFRLVKIPVCGQKKPEMIMWGIKTPFYYPTKADIDLGHPPGAYTQQSIDTFNEIYDVNRLIARNP